MTNEDTPELPVAYQLKVFDALPSVREKASSLAKSGADEGTLVWAKRQTRGYGLGGKPWTANEGDFHCGIILRPEFPSRDFYQMNVVGCLALGNALAAHLSPMTALGFGWPNKLLIANQRIGGLWIDSEYGADPWLVVSCSVNIQSHPNWNDSLGMSIAEAEGSTSLTSAALLETYSREFITQINHWAERGFDYSLRQWKGRMQFDMSPREYGQTVNGVLESVTDQGEALVKSVDGILQTVAIETHMRREYE